MLNFIQPASRPDFVKVTLTTYYIKGWAGLLQSLNRTIMHLLRRSDGTFTKPCWNLHGSIMLHRNFTGDVIWRLWISPNVSGTIRHLIELLSRSDVNAMTIPRNHYICHETNADNVTESSVVPSLRGCGHVSLRVDTVTLPMDGQTDKVVCFTRTLPNKL